VQKPIETRRDLETRAVRLEGPAQRRVLPAGRGGGADDTGFRRPRLFSPMLSQDSAPASGTRATVPWSAVYPPPHCRSLRMGSCVPEAPGTARPSLLHRRAFRSSIDRCDRRWRRLDPRKLAREPGLRMIGYLGRDGRQHVALMAAGGGAFFGWPVSNTLVVFGLPDVSRKPLPGAVSKAVAAWAATHRGVPKVGAFAPTSVPPPAPSRPDQWHRLLRRGCCDQPTHEAGHTWAGRRPRSDWGPTKGS
jgi:hypothetical protein